VIECDFQKVRQFLPHRYPFLFVDRVMSIQTQGDLSQLKASDDKVGTRVKAIKNVTINEPYFQGHFPEFPIMPGVLQFETMAQAASFTMYPYVKKCIFDLPNPVQYDMQCMLLGVNQSRFRKAVHPGDQLIIETELKKCRTGLWVFDCQISVDGKKVSEAELLANISVTVTSPTMTSSTTTSTAEKTT
jgi:3-hydroxyacyl-[acyl-carrier-protein] dehydratase